VGGDILNQYCQSDVEASWRPVIDKVFSFEDARAAYARIESGRHIGKVVIKLAQ
jgi:NADPH:quinone reductase-like Zn-dependent oxidoreductase